MSTSNASVTSTLEALVRDLRARGQHATARELEKEIPGARAAAKRVSTRPSASKDPRLERSNALVASALGEDRNRVNKLIGNTVYVGVPEDYQPR
jgi:hypothetical protein